jgi:fluoride exporter
MYALSAYLLVAIGGAVGSMARYAVTLAATWAWGPEFPWGTLIINVVGSFIITYFGALTAPYGTSALGPRLLVMVGFCGGFTTFSSFSLQTLELAHAGHRVGVAANILLSVCLCLAAAWAGYYAAAVLGTVHKTEP